MGDTQIHEIEVQGGHQVIAWRTDDEQSVARAEGAFDALKKEGYDFFEVEEKTVHTKGSPIRSFKRTLGRVVAVPGTIQESGSRRMRGGPPTMSSS